MPFFPPDQIDLILKGLKAKLTDAQASHYITLVAETLSRFPDPDKEMEGDEKFLDESQLQILRTVQYVADDDLYGKEGFISHLIDIYNNNEALANRSDAQQVENVQLITHLIFEPFLKKYQKTAWRNNQQYGAKFNEFQDTFRIFFAVCWRYRSIHLPYGWIAEALFDAVEVFLKQYRIDITQLSPKEFINPIVNKAFTIFLKIIGGEDKLPNFEPLLNQRNPINEVNKRQIIENFQAQITSYLIDHTLPALKKSQAKVAGEMGIDICKSSLDVNSGEWLPDTVVDAILQDFLVKSNLSTVEGHYVAKASAVYSVSLLKSELEKAFLNQRGEIHAYFPINTGGHWLFFKITQTFADDKRQFHVLQIDSMAGDTHATDRICHELQSIFGKKIDIFPKTTATKQQSGVDGYTCGDRTIGTLINTLLTDLQTAFPGNNLYKNVTNPWQNTNPNNPQSIRRVTLQWLQKIKLKSRAIEQAPVGMHNKTGASQTTGDNTKLPIFSMFCVCLATLFLLGCIITGGFGIGVLAGSLVAAQAFTLVFGAATTTAAGIGIGVGFLGGLGLLAMYEPIKEVWNGLQSLWTNEFSATNPEPPVVQPLKNSMPDKPSVNLSTSDTVTTKTEQPPVHPPPLTPGLLKTDQNSEIQAQTPPAKLYNIGSD